MTKDESLDTAIQNGIFADKLAKHVERINNVDLDTIQTPWSSVGYLTYKRTYSRKLSGRTTDTTDQDTEEWKDTIDRIVLGCREQLECGFTPEEEHRLRYYLLSLKASVAGRFLWQLGTTTVSKLGLASLQNCAFVCVDEPIKPFTWTFDMLMLGSGVGYNIQREYVYKLPKLLEGDINVDRKDDASADFIVPDSREGWVRLLEATLRAFFETGESFTYSTQLIRSKGAPIRGFGGVASGPEELVWGINEITKILKSRQGNQLRPIDCLDIMNIIGYIVVSGNVRRSAQIAIGDYDDFDFLRAKRWDIGNIPNWRGMSNNSVVCNDISKLPEEFWDGYKGNGEPYGLINLKLARACGRIGESQYRDARVAGFNPCAEQSLEPYETCCLAELFLPNITSDVELFDVSSLLYRVCKHSLGLRCHQSRTEHVVRTNFRMGLGATGYLQASEVQRQWLRPTYSRLREYDETYSKAHGFPRSIKLTTVKPSGTLSLLPGVTPGAHPAYARYLIRRIRIASNHTLVQVCREAGYPVEYQVNFDGSEDHNTCVVEFPFRYPDGTTLAKDTSATDQLDIVRRLQTEWSDNAVSCTVYYTADELPNIREYLSKHYNKNFKTLSFLLGGNEHGFKQAPLEEISEEEYFRRVQSSTPITSVANAEYESNDECASGLCPIK